MPVPVPHTKNLKADRVNVFEFRQNLVNQYAEFTRSFNRIKADDISCRKALAKFQKRAPERTAALLGNWISLTLVLTGCANLSDSVDNRVDFGERGIDGALCVGSLVTPATGLSESSNPALVAKARMSSGQGGVCSGKVFAATAPVVLYRVFDSSKPHTKFGAWWSLSPPGSSRADYRAANAICPEWSQLDRLVACEIRPGSELVLGTTQSAQCAEGTGYAKTGQTQVYVANDGRAGIIHVGNCTEETSWP